MHYLTCCVLLDMLPHLLIGAMSHYDPETQLHRTYALLNVLLDMMPHVLICAISLNIMTQRHSYMHYLMCCLM